MSSLIASSLLPGWPVPLPGAREGLDAALETAGVKYSTLAPEGLYVGDATIATNFLNSYVGSAVQLAWAKTNPQGSGLLDQLNTLMANNAVLFAYSNGVASGIIPAGTVTTLTGTQIANFLATAVNNYRSLRAAINAATSLAQLQAININSGWPSNP